MKLWLTNRIRHRCRTQEGRHLGFLVVYKWKVGKAWSSVLFGSIYSLVSQQGNAACTRRTQGSLGLLTGPCGAGPVLHTPLLSCEPPVYPLSPSSLGVCSLPVSLGQSESLQFSCCLHCTSLCQAEDHWERQGVCLVTRYCPSQLTFCHFWHRRKVTTAPSVSTDDCTTPWSGLNCLRSRGCRSPGEPGLRNGYGQPGPVPRTTEPAG